jgi:hypothetical protein
MDYPAEAGIAAAPQPTLLSRSYPAVRVLLQLLLAAGLLAGLLWRVDLGAVRDDLRDAGLWWLPLAFAANLGSDWFRAIRWRELLKPMSPAPVTFLWGTAILGVATNIAVPFRAGEVVRVQVVRRRTGLGVASVVATLLSEKMMDIVAFSAFIVLGIVLYDDARFLWPLAVAYGAVLAAGLLGARWLARRSDGEPEVRSQPEGRWRAWVATERHAFGKGLQAFRRPGPVAVLIASSLAAWTFEAMQYYFCGKALGVDLSPAVYLLVVVAATIAVSVPVTQAGLGVFELAIAGLLVAFGIDESEAAAFAIFSHVMLALPYLAAGPIAAFALRLSPVDVFFLRVRGEQPAMAPASPAN